MEKINLHVYVKSYASLDSICEIMKNDNHTLVQLNLNKTDINTTTYFTILLFSELSTICMWLYVILMNIIEIWEH